MKISSRLILFVAAACLLTLALPVFSPTAFAVSYEGDIGNGLIKRKSIDTEHFRMEFSNLIMNQADEDGNGVADLIDVVAEAAEDSWDQEVETMGYEEPIQETEHKVIVIFDEKDEYLSTGAIGVTGVLSNGEPYIAIDPWMDDDYLRITIAHEFFHSIQFGYDTSFALYNHGVNWAEATATWMEDIVFDSVDDYVNYLPDYFDYTDYSVFAALTPTDTLFEYALNIWPRFLHEYYDYSIIREIWEDYFDSSTSDSDVTKVYDSATDAVEAEGDELQDVYREFTLWNLAPSDSYDEGDDYPEVNLISGEQDIYKIIDDEYAPALYGANYLFFSNSGSEDDFYFHMIKADGVSFNVSLVPMDGDEADLDELVYEFADTDEEFTEALILEDLNGDDVVAVISPIWSEDAPSDSVFDQGHLYYYLASFGSDISDDIQVDTEVEEAEEKDGEESTADEGRDTGLSLSVMEYDEDSVRLSWNRIVDDEISSYEVLYGMANEDGDVEYDSVKEISRASTTFGTVSDLEEGETYHFQLFALDEDGDQFGDESNEVAVIPEEWLFTDLSFLDDHYDSISALVDEGVFGGYDDGSFGADNTINRAELLKILIEGQGITPDEDEYKDCFPDVEDDWYAKYVCYAEAQDWVDGYADGDFKPAKTVNKVEALKMLFNVYEAGLVEGTRVSELPYPDLSTKVWFSIYVWEASELGILTETPGEDFDPSDGRNRGDMAEELYRYLVVEELIKE
jgi:hypothetical protein